MKASFFAFGFCFPVLLLASDAEPPYSYHYDHHGLSQIVREGEKTEGMFEEKENPFSLSFGIDFKSKLTLYGVVYNEDPILVPRAAIGYGDWFNFEVSAYIDLTRYGGKKGAYGDRKWKYEEFCFGPTVMHQFGDVLLSASYFYEYYSRSTIFRDKQTMTVGAALPDIFLSPSVSLEIEFTEAREAAYLLFGCGHTFTLVEDALFLELSGGIGFGNSKRNRYDTGFNSAGVKDIFASAALLWRVSERVTVSPYVTVSQLLHSRMRESIRGMIDDYDTGYVLLGLSVNVVL